MRRAIVDTGPLVAFLDRAEQHHSWVIERIDELQPPLLLCEPVLAEAMHLLARFPRGQSDLLLSALRRLASICLSEVMTECLKPPEAI
jgi:predicted nucleic acid-binding protein